MTDPAPSSSEQPTQQIVPPSPPMMQGIQPPTGLNLSAKVQGSKLESLQAAMGELLRCSTAREANRRVQSGTISLLDRTRRDQDIQQLRFKRSKPAQAV